MDFKVVIFLLVFSAIVYVLNSLFRSSEEKKNQDQPTSRPKEPVGRPRATSGDIDRFLEEINRRREAAERKKSAENRPASQASSLPRAQPARPQPYRRRPGLP